MQGSIATVLVGTLIVGVVSVTPGRAAAAEISSVDAPTGAVKAIEPNVSAFEDAFKNRSDCVGDAQIVFVDLTDRKGEYRPGGVVALDRSDSVESMPTVVIHELGHHLMVSCAIYLDQPFQERFYTAQGLSATRSWFDYSQGWTAAPAEHFAEAVALYAVGKASGRITITPAAMELIAEVAGAASATATPRPWNPGVDRALVVDPEQALAARTTTALSSWGSANRLNATQSGMAVTTQTRTPSAVPSVSGSVDSSIVPLNPWSFQVGSRK